VPTSKPTSSGSIHPAFGYDPLPSCESVDIVAFRWWSVKRTATA
jgi:hypothetical protein